MEATHVPGHVLVHIKVHICIDDLLENHHDFN